MIACGEGFRDLSVVSIIMVKYFVVVFYYLGQLSVCGEFNVYNDVGPVCFCER